VWRFVADSRDEGAEERLGLLENSHGVFRCHTILNCVEACPKNLNPTKAIASIKRAIVERKF
jgi:succinate dehydrogenase / fumarate reductase iron-sulfur subunit